MYSYMCAPFIYLLFLLLHISATASTSDQHVCILGAGISAASTAHFLTNRQPRPKITVFEKSSIPGGRIATLNIPGAPPIEAGASIIAADNKLMSYFTDFLNLSHHEMSSTTMGLWDGSRFLFRTQSSRTRNMLALSRRYGISLMRMHRHVSQLLTSYANLYPLLGVAAHWLPYPTVETLLARAPILSQLSQKSLLQITPSLFSDTFTTEMVGAITRVNYGQDPIQMNALSGSVAMAGTGGGLWAVTGGNVQVVQGLLETAAVDIHLNTTVHAVQEAPSNTYLVISNDKRWHCDAVVMATPVELANISLPDTVHQKIYVGRSFQKTVATFVKGTLNENTFGPGPPESVLTIAGTRDSFTSIGKAWAGDTLPVFKVFSTEQLDKTAIDRIFHPGAKLIAEYPWLAYPKYSPPHKFAKFDVNEQHQRIFIYTSPLESAGSAMEMSALSGANAAALVRQRLGLDVEIEHENEGREEL